MPDLGGFVKREREARGWSRSKLARKMETSAAQVSRIESGKRPNPTPETIVRLARAFGCTIEDVFVGAGFAESDEALLKVQEAVRAGKTKLLPVFKLSVVGLPILADANISGFKEVPAETVNDGSYIFVRASDDAMEPTLKRDSFLLVKLQNDAKDGEIVLVERQNSEPLVRRIHRVETKVLLTADNPTWETLVK